MVFSKSYKFGVDYNILILVRIIFYVYLDIISLEVRGYDLLLCFEEKFGRLFKEIY